MDGFKEAYLEIIDNNTGTKTTNNLYYGGRLFSYDSYYDELKESGSTEDRIKNSYTEMNLDAGNYTFNFNFVADGYQNSIDPTIFNLYIGENCSSIQPLQTGDVELTAKWKLNN